MSHGGLATISMVHARLFLLALPSIIDESNSGRREPLDAAEVDCKRLNQGGKKNNVEYRWTGNAERRGRDKDKVCLGRRRDKERKGGGEKRETDTQRTKKIGIPASVDKQETQKDVEEIKITPRAQKDAGIERQTENIEKCKDTEKKT